MRIFISAGEASGDLHAAALTREILSLAPDAEVFGMGGDALRSAGGEVIFDYKDNSVMGFVEVLRKLPDLFRLRDAFRQVMVERKYTYGFKYSKMGYASAYSWLLFVIIFALTGVQMKLQKGWVHYES